MLQLTPAVVLAMLLQAPHDCWPVPLPPPQFDRLPVLERLPPVLIADSFWEIDGICRGLGVTVTMQRGSDRSRIWACTASIGVVWMPPQDDQFSPAEWQCLLYHEVRGHFGGAWPADHPGAIF